MTAEKEVVRLKNEVGILETAISDLTATITTLKKQFAQSEAQNYCKICGRALDGYRASNDEYLIINAHTGKHLTAKEIIEHIEELETNWQKEIEENEQLKKAIKPFVDFARSDTGRKPYSPASVYPVPGLIYQDFLDAVKTYDEITGEG